MNMPKPNIDKLFNMFLKAIPYIVIVILILLLNKQCKATENFTRFYHNEKQTVELYKNKLGTLTASVNASELSEKQLKELVLKKDDSLRLLAKEFHKVKYITQIKEVIKVDSVFVPYEFEIDCEFKRFGKYDTDSHFKFNYSLNQSGFSLSDIQIPNKQKIMTGTKRKWFLGKQTLHTDITNTNPYIQTQEIQTIIVPVQTEWYNNKWVYLGVGALVGFHLAK